MKPDRLVVICPKGCALVSVEERDGVLTITPRGSGPVPYALNGPIIDLGCRHRRHPVAGVSQSDVRAWWERGDRGRMLAYSPDDPYDTEHILDWI